MKSRQQKQNRTRGISAKSTAETSQLVLWRNDEPYDGIRDSYWGVGLEAGNPSANLPAIRLIARDVRLAYTPLIQAAIDMRYWGARRARRLAIWRHEAT